MNGNLKEYGTRKCLVCGKDFEAHKPAQVTCSEKCRTWRRKTLKRVLQKYSRDFCQDNIEWLNSRLEELICNQKKTRKQDRKEKTDDKKAPEKYRHICARCGSTFKSAYKDDSYCSEQCANESSCGIM